MVTLPVVGQSNWDVPLNAALTDLQNQVNSLVFSVDADGGAVGDGSTDDQAAIQSILDAAPLGSVVMLGPKQYALGGKLTLPPYVTLRGPFLDRDGVADATPCLLPLAGFTDAMVIEMVDQATGGYPVENRDAALAYVNIDGRNLSTETVAGVTATGFVHGAHMLNVAIHDMTDHAVKHVAGGSGSPYSWYFFNVQLSGSSGATTDDGFHLISTDHVLVGCRTLGIQGYGFYLNGCSNTQVLGCRAEWSKKSGFYITGSWGVSTGSGGVILSDCSTDRNTEYGLLIDSTGNSPVIVNGFHARRDGRNAGAGGGSFAGLRGTNATTPIVVTGMTCYPGVDDDGTGTSSPERGTSFGGCTWASVSDSYLHAATTAFHDAGTNTPLLRGPNVGTSTGPTAAPVRAALEPWSWRGTATASNSTDVSALSVTNSVANTNAHISVTSFTAGSDVLRSQVTGEAVGRFDMLANGSMSFGGGAATRDCTFSRTAANQLSFTTADVRIATAGRGVMVAEGSNAKMGATALTAGAATVSTTAVTANSRIQLTSQVDGGTPGFLRVSARTAGVSFTITSSSGTDTSTVAWLIVEPA